MSFVMRGNEIILLVDQSHLNFEILQKALRKADITDEIIQIPTLEESISYLRKNNIPNKIFIEMTQILVSTPDRFNEIIKLKKDIKPLITCLVFSKYEIEVMESQGLLIDYYLELPNFLAYDAYFIKTLREMADRVKKGGNRIAGSF